MNGLIRFLKETTEFRTMTGERDDVNTTTVGDRKKKTVRGTNLKIFSIWMKQDCLFVKQPTKVFIPKERTVLVENNPREGLLLHIGLCEG